MASKTRPCREVVFHLVSNVNSKRPKKTAKITICGVEGWSSVSAVLHFDFGTRADVFLFDPSTGDAKKWLRSDREVTYYVTKRACTPGPASVWYLGVMCISVDLTPEGKSSKYAYLYRQSWTDIRCGDTVSVFEKEGTFFVESGKGGRESNPQVLVRSREDSKITMTTVAWALTLVERSAVTVDQSATNNIPVSSSSPASHKSKSYNILQPLDETSVLDEVPKSLASRFMDLEMDNSRL